VYIIAARALAPPDCAGGAAVIAVTHGTAGGLFGPIRRSGSAPTKNAARQRVVLGKLRATFSEEVT